MPCSDSSSSIAITFDADEKMKNFDFAKITCGREISADTGYAQYCQGRTPQEVIALPFAQAVEELGLKEEEEQFVLYLEWDALRAALVQYLGTDEKDIDKHRCQITSIDHSEDEIEVALVILPPQEMPKILPCNLGDDRYKKYEEDINEKKGETT